MTKQEVKQYALTIAEVLADKKGKDILVIDVEKVTPFFDFLVIANADSYLHLDALSRFVNDKLSELKIKKINPTYDIPENPWILIDCGFMVVHLFTQEARDFYSLEKLWAEGEVIYNEANVEEMVLV